MDSRNEELKESAGSNRDFWHELEVLDRQHWLSESFQGSGEITFSGTLRISGKWTGAVLGSGSDCGLHVLKSGIVQGKVRVAKVVVEGRCDFEELICDFLHVVEGALVSGKIKAKTVVVDPGAIVQAEFQSQPR